MAISMAAMAVIMAVIIAASIELPLVLCCFSHSLFRSLIGILRLPDSFHPPSSCPASSSNHVPVRFSPSPSLFGVGSLRFTFVLRLDSQDSTMRFEGPHPCTGGTLHKCGASLLN